MLYEQNGFVFMLWKVFSLPPGCTTHRHRRADTTAWRAKGFRVSGNRACGHAASYIVGWRRRNNRIGGRVAPPDRTIHAPGLVARPQRRGTGSHLLLCVPLFVSGGRGAVKRGSLSKILPEPV